MADVQLGRGVGKHLSFINILLLESNEIALAQHPTAGLRSYIKDCGGHITASGPNKQGSVRQVHCLCTLPSIHQPKFHY